MHINNEKLEYPTPIDDTNMETEHLTENRKKHNLFIYVEYKLSYNIIIVCK